MICFKFTSKLFDSGVLLSCHYMKFGQSACMFHISYGFQCRQDRRYIADSNTSALRTGDDDITSSECLHIRRICRWNLKFISLHRSTQFRSTKHTLPIFISLYKSTRHTDKPIRRKLQIHRIDKSTSNLASISNSAEHSGQLLFPDLGSTLWLKQNGYFRKLSIMSWFSRPYIKPFADPLNFAGLVCP